MSASSSREAVESLLVPLQRAVTCVTQAVLVERTRPTRLGGARSVTLSDGVARLRGPSHLALAVLHAFDVKALPGARSSWRAQSVGYAYEFQHRDGRTLLAYHWHPIGPSPITTPHLHLGGTVTGIDLSKAHLPTGSVTLQDVLRFAILDLGVEPLRDDWPQILARPVPAAG